MVIRRMQDIESPIARRRAEVGWSQARLVTMTRENGTPVSLSTVQLAERGVLTARTARILGAVLNMDPEALLPARRPDAG